MVNLRRRRREEEEEELEERSLGTTAMAVGIGAVMAVNRAVEKVQTAGHRVGEGAGKVGRRVKRVFGSRRYRVAPEPVPVPEEERPGVVGQGLEDLL